MLSILTGRFADGGNHATEISSMKQKTRAPTKLWTSRSWWKEVPGQNEVKLIITVVLQRHNIK